MAYDPLSRTVVDRYISQYSYSASDLAVFLEKVPSEYILIIVTHHSRRYQESAELTAALESCGGSNIWDSGVTSGSADTYGYVLIGRCKAGLTAGDSAALGYEYKSDVSSLTIEIQTDPLKNFKMTIPSSRETIAGQSNNVPTFTYDKSKTPYIKSISRRNGTTAGGTTVHIFGEGFLPGNTTIYLAGVECVTEYSHIGSYRDQHLCWEGVNCAGLGVHNENEITCLSGVWDYNGEAFRREVIVNVQGRVMQLQRMMFGGVT